MTDRDIEHLGILAGHGHDLADRAGRERRWRTAAGRIAQTRRHPVGRRGVGGDDLACAASTPTCSFCQDRRILVPCFSSSHSPAPHNFNPVLSTSRCTGSLSASLPERNRVVGKPDRQAPSLAQTRVIRRPGRHVALLLRDVVATRGVGLVRHERFRIRTGDASDPNPFHPLQSLIPATTPPRWRLSLV
jgi:hypothetical protein